MHLLFNCPTYLASTFAIDTAQSRVGLCRDYFYWGIALCRSLIIPARMVVGYLYQLEPMDLHTWFEVFIRHRWYAFDASQTEPRGNRVAIAYGRDASGVALTTQFGSLNLIEMKVWVEAFPHLGDPNHYN
ncbi:MAG: transglutaminase family protein [Leptolyngbyaceae cyanobacterium SM2_5_2]|nr:transglutaminase family protein [Leptolyngbyaceae cyanobacterium SM2_5_2]